MSNQYEGPRLLETKTFVLGNLIVSVVAWFGFFFWWPKYGPGSIGTIFYSLTFPLYCIFLAFGAARSKALSMMVTAGYFIAAFSTLVLIFSATYWIYGTTANFNVNVTRLDAIYFTIGTLSTAGTGNINATSELMRGIQALQMVLDAGLVVFAVGVLVARLSSSSDRKSDRSSKHPQRDLHAMVPLSPFNSSRIVRFAARISGLASGLALAVRPAVAAEVSARKGGSRRCFLRSGRCGAVGKDLRVPLRVEGPTRTMRGIPPGCCDILPAIAAPSTRVTVWSCCWRARHWGGTPGIAGGRSRGAVRRQPPRRRTIVRRTRRKLPPRNGETPGEPQPPTAVHLGRPFPLDCPRPSSLFTAWAVRPGAPKVRP
jgi:hypothetical protein